MIQPSLEEYRKLSEQYQYTPLYTRIMGDTLTPVLVYQSIRHLSEYSYLLESVQQNEKLGRYSFIGLNPGLIVQSNGEEIEVTSWQGEKQPIHGNPFEVIQELMESYRPAILPDLAPYNGGVVGYFGYDTIRHIEAIPNNNPEELALPESLFILPKTVIVFDHLVQSVTLIELIASKDAESYQKGSQNIEMLLKLLEKGPEKQRHKPIPSHAKEPSYTSNMTQAEYEAAVRKAKHYIVEGDIFQVVLSQRFSMDYQGDPFEVYRSLRRVNPSPYLFYLSFPDFTIAGSSPEILVKREGDTLTLRPIAGTRPRGKTAAEDEALAEDLLNDPKEIAEHMMLVDLGRNDLGRICKFGTVRPTKFKFIENYSHVMHVVTNLEGKVDNAVRNSHILQSCFPAGTLSGAPKVRAMEIIDELEVSRRGFYGGTVANLDFAGNFDACIGIRSVVMKEGKAHIQAGAGIVADSVPEKEHQECVNKAKAVMKAIQLSQEEGQ